MGSLLKTFEYHCITVCVLQPKANKHYCTIQSLDCHSIPWIALQPCYLTDFNLTGCQPYTAPAQKSKSIKAYLTLALISQVLFFPASSKHHGFKKKQRGKSPSWKCLNKSPGNRRGNSEWKHFLSPCWVGGRWVWVIVQPPRASEWLYIPDGGGRVGIISWPDHVLAVWGGLGVWTHTVIMRLEWWSHTLFWYITGYWYSA